MEDEYWKKRYEKLLEIIQDEGDVRSIQHWKEIVEEEIEVEEIEHEQTVEDAKVRKVMRHDTP